VGECKREDGKWKIYGINGRGMSEENIHEFHEKKGLNRNGISIRKTATDSWIKLMINRKKLTLISRRKGESNKVWTS
jgi:hypothetical protein